MQTKVSDTGATDQVAPDTAGAPLGAVEAGAPPAHSPEPAAVLSPFARPCGSEYEPTEGEDALLNYLRGIQRAGDSPEEFARWRALGYIENEIKTRVFSDGDYEGDTIGREQQPQFHAALDLLAAHVRAKGDAAAGRRPAGDRETPAGGGQLGEPRQRRRQAEALLTLVSLQTDQVAKEWPRLGDELYALTCETPGLPITLPYPRQAAYFAARSLFGPEVLGETPGDSQDVAAFRMEERGGYVAATFEAVQAILRGPTDCPEWQMLRLLGLQAHRKYGAVVATPDEGPDEGDAVERTVAETDRKQAEGERIAAGVMGTLGALLADLERYAKEEPAAGDLTPDTPGTWALESLCRAQGFAAKPGGPLGDRPEDVATVAGMLYGRENLPHDDAFECGARLRDLFAALQPIATAPQGRDDAAFILMLALGQTVRRRYESGTATAGAAA